MEVTKKEHNIIHIVLELISFLVTCFVLTVKAIFFAIVPISQKHIKNFDGEIVLITGGAGGIGRLVALRLAKLKAIIVLWDIDSKGIDESVKMVKASGGIAYGYRCDLTNREEIYKVAESVTKEIGQVTILINNAGVANEKFILDTPDESIQRTFDVNILAHFWTVKAFLRKMIENNHGHIVTIASLAGHIGVHNLVDYCSSKFAAVGFDEALRIELEKFGANGVKTTVVCPYFIQATGMFNDVKSKFLSTLKSTQVADEIVIAIQMEKLCVIIPGYLRFVFLKWIFPWSVISLFLKSVINNTPPSSPEVMPSDNDNTKKEEVNFQKITENELNRRIWVDDKL